ncbi:uncharacterized protein LOC125231355 [Leguminivora glycinivorella]|uniref:uncharacterized protein LOC125231355 n=1 Tax=Leguminivora glycinivorella TaxID=1035111 RepID=UPI00200BC8DB|nr:uncharacterized protein LOC125231355 [Leguminivora glycinivorella]
MNQAVNRILQANINHCAGAQDLLLQSMAQWSIDVAVVAEPYYIPPNHNWAADVDGLVAIITKAGAEGITLLSRGQGYVAVIWGDITLIGVYFSPNKRVSEFEALLGHLAALVGQTQPRQVVVAGDLNAKSMAWGCPATNIRGDLLEEWATMTGMSILNRGSASTCVRWQGESIVDAWLEPSLDLRNGKCIGGLEKSQNFDAVPTRRDVSTLGPADEGGPRRRRGVAAVQRIQRGGQDAADFHLRSEGERQSGASRDSKPRSMGRPYKAVRGKLRPWAPPLTESLEPRLLEVVVSSLFPNRPEHQPPAMAPPRQRAGYEVAEVEVPPVTEAELDAAVFKLKAKNTAPGPDGIPGRVLALALRALGERFRGLLDACLQSGRFPTIWKTGRLVLLKKTGDPRILHQPTVRSCCSTRLTSSSSVSSAVASSSTSGEWDPICPNTSLDSERAGRHRVLPFGAVCGVPSPGRRADKVGDIVRCSTGLGLRAASVEHRVRLGPAGELLPGSNVTCYADDTLVTSRGTSYREAARLATVTVAQVVRRIAMLGLEVALHKSEALCFHTARKAPPAEASIVVGGTRIEVKSNMKYLGLVLDSRWNFREHFVRLTPRLMAASAALKRLMPNIGGPEVASRRLYMGVVRSMALYGAPIWAENLAARNIALLKRAQRAMAISVVRGYRTTSYDAACLLAGTPPWNLKAEAQASLYEWRRDLRLQEYHPAPREVEAQKLLVQQSIVLQWEEQLAEREEGHRTVEAIRPVLQDWLEREWGSLTFRLVQVLTGHGCFGSYLHRFARREVTAECHQCRCDEDTAQHTLEECPAWAGQRRDLVAVVGDDLSLPAVVKAMVANERSWKAVLFFCEDVMSQKEAAEREREADPASHPIRRKRTGARRRAYAHLLPPT